MKRHACDWLRKKPRLGALAEDLPPNLERVLESSLQAGAKTHRDVVFETLPHFRSKDSHASVRKTAVSALEKLAAKNPWLRRSLEQRKNFNKKSETFDQQSESLHFPRTDASPK